VLRQALGQAERWGLVTRHAARLAEPPRVPRHEIRPLTPDQARTFLDAIRGDRLEALYLVALDAGPQTLVLTFGERGSLGLA